MRHSCCGDAEYRFGDYGPAYLLRGGNTDIGVVRLRPGDDVVNHLHSRVEESFYVIEGSATLWVDCATQHTLAPGDVYQCPPGEMHYFQNTSDADFRMLFVKAPYDPDDTTSLPWTPGEPRPEGAPARG
jgi:quercetin dioxygenase-like cupin family protein